MVRKLYIFMENHRLSIFDTSVLRFISESQKDELTGGWKHDELHNQHTTKIP
jgi:hypothetical protein